MMKFISGYSFTFLKTESLAPVILARLGQLFDSAGHWRK